jgi:hypothetical protein
MRSPGRATGERHETSMTDTLALWDDANSLESRLAALDAEVEDAEIPRPGWTHPIPSEQRPRVLMLLTPGEGAPAYTHVVNGYYQPVLHTRARPALLPGSEAAVAELRAYVDIHNAGDDYRPLTIEEAYDLEAILARCPVTAGLCLDRTKPSIPMAGWMYVTVRDSPQPGTWLAKHGPYAPGRQWPEFFILAWEPRP